MYLNDLQKSIKQDEASPNVMNECIDYLLYADDLVLLSTSESGLQKHLDCLGIYYKNGMKA